MNRRPNRKATKTVAILSLVAFLMASAASPALAERDDRRGNRSDRHSRYDHRDDRRYDHRRYRPGYHVRTLPRGTKVVRAGRNRYYYYSGLFFRPGAFGFISVSAPIGAFVLSIPFGYRTVHRRGHTYYVCNDVWYRPSVGGYMVVTEPDDDDPAPRASTDERTGKNVAVVVKRLNVRSGPGTNFNVVETLKMGDRLDIRGTSPGWLYVEYDSGAYGWVEEKYTAETMPGAKG